MRIVIISDTDSRKNWARSVIQHFDAEMTTNIQNIFDIFQKQTFNEIDVIILALGGGANYKFLLKFHKYVQDKKPTKRPMIISGFNGSTDTDNIHALLCRVGSDFICLNSNKDYDDFSNQLKKLNFSNSSLILTGLAKSYGDNETKLDKDKIVFFAQPDVPKTKRERIYIVKKLHELAKKFPEKKVYIKPRSKKDALNITHKEKYYYQDILKELNIQDVHLIYDDVEAILPSTDLSITVGSTVAFESIHCSIDTVVLSDFGIRQEYGNHHFIGSGCLLSFDDILCETKPFANKEWKDKYVLIDNAKYDLLVDKVLTKLEQQINSNSMFPLEPLYYTQQNASYFFQNALRINTKKTHIFNKIRNLIKKILP